MLSLLRAVTEEISKYKLVALKHQANIHFYMERGINHEFGTGFLYIKESYQQLRR
jgi:hypothetical protein